MREIEKVHEEFAQLANYVGGDSLLTQGAGGNISIKVDSYLLIKSSGTRLGEYRSVFDLALVDCLKGIDGDLDGIRLDPRMFRGRPSIETPLHLIFPQRIVCHLHTCGSLATSIQTDVISAGRVSGIPVCEYLPPGDELANEILRLNFHLCNQVLLANHGLIIAGESVQEVRERLDQVESRLRKDTYRPRPSIIDTEDGDLHGSADSQWLSALSNGIFWPDEAVMLGSKPFGQTGLIETHSSGRFRASRKLTTDQRELVRVLLEVGCFVPPGATLSYLDDASVVALLNREDEKYRQRIASE